MTLIQDPLHPVRRHYVLKLDRHANPAKGVVSGRVENLATGQLFDFDDANSLLEGLARELAEEREASTSPPGVE